VHRQGPSKCFVERDLYTSFMGDEAFTDIEKLFFGRIDTEGKVAVELLTDYSLAKWSPGAFQNLLTYLGTQKLRTPKGLEWLAAQAGTNNRELILRHMIDNRRMYAAIWSECVWLVADATQSATKFIVSDNPVTVYNRGCGPSSKWCRHFNDPDIRLHGTHTVFPLSLDKVLILTNLSWVRNPYQSPTEMRPNDTLGRAGIFKAMDVQTERHLDEREVREINFIIKSRARRYIAAAEEEWLFPERYVSKSQWAEYGDGYLLMPDPRGVYIGGTVYIGRNDGTSDAFDEYGRKPWKDGFQSGGGYDESASLYRFKGEFARLYGPVRRGRKMQFGELESERDGDEVHQHHLSEEERNRRLMRGRPRR